MKNKIFIKNLICHMILKTYLVNTYMDQNKWREDVLREQTKYINTEIKIKKIVNRN